MVGEQSQPVLPVAQLSPLLPSCCSQGKSEECSEGQGEKGRGGTVLAEDQDLSWALAGAGLARAGHYCVDQQV